MPFGDYMGQHGKKAGKFGDYLSEKDVAPLGHSTAGQAQKDELTGHAPAQQPLPAGRGPAKGPAPSQFQMDPTMPTPPIVKMDGGVAPPPQPIMPDPVKGEQFAKSAPWTPDPGTDTSDNPFGSYMANASPDWANAMQGTLSGDVPGLASLDAAEKSGLAQLQADQALANQSLDEQAHAAGIGASGAYAQGLEGLTTQGSLAQQSFKADMAEKKAQQTLAWIDTKLKTLTDLYKTTTDAATKMSIQEEIGQLEQQKIDTAKQAEQFQEMSDFSDTTEAMLSQFLEDSGMKENDQATYAVTTGWNTAQSAIWVMLSQDKISYEEALALLNEYSGDWFEALGELNAGDPISDPNALWANFKAKHPELFGESSLEML